jgi:SRSO17 transposase
MAVVTPQARVVQGLLRRPSQLLSRPQRSHLVGLVLALLSGSTAKLRPLAERSSATRHRTCVGRFLAVTEWDEAAALGAQYAEVLRRMRLRRGDSIELILDDTRFAKRGRKMDDLSRMWDHAHASFAHGHTLLVAAVRARGVTLPWALRLWLPKRSAGRHYQKLTDMAAQLIAQFQPPKGVRVNVLFDAAFLCPQVTKACESQGFHWYSVAVRSRRFWRQKRNRFEKIQQFGPGVLKHRGRRVRLKRVRGWRWMRVAAERGALPRIGAAQLVLSKRPRDPWKNMIAVVTNDLRVTPRQAIVMYERRWAIEVLFKELRSLGLGAYQMLHRKGIVRHWHLVSLAHLALTHHALAAIDDTAKKLKEQIPLPTLRHRLDALRRQLRDDQIRGFTRRIRSTRVRRRVQEFLANAA